MTISHDLTTDMSNDDDSNVWLDIDLQDDQEQTEADVSPVRQPKKTSFKVLLSVNWKKKVVVVDWFCYIIMSVSEFICSYTWSRKFQD